MNRRNFLISTAALPMVFNLNSGQSFLASDGQGGIFSMNDLTKKLPLNILKLVQNVLDKKPGDMNTDWDGTIQIEGLIRLSRSVGISGLNLAENWFKYHLGTSSLSDEEILNMYSGMKSRVIREAPIPFSLYAGTIGLAIPSDLLYKETGLEEAKEQSITIANALIHYCSRDGLGFLAHDDASLNKMAIPDVVYFMVRSLGGASELVNSELSKVYLKQAAYQVKLAIDHFLDEKTGLCKTGTFNNIPGKTYWTRAQGWLLWSLTGLLKYIPQNYPGYDLYIQSMEKHIGALMKYQGKKGGLHVWVDDPDSPEEVTGIAMSIASIKCAIRAGWLKNDYSELIEKGWDFIKKSVDRDGKIHNVYTGWARPAENKVLDMDAEQRGYVSGIIMVAADEMVK
ncbi:glycoside hydrolase family 88 protein [Bacteroidota bacterium]